jgi:hypothetical protein
LNRLIETKQQQQNQKWNTNIESKAAVRMAANNGFVFPKPWKFTTSSLSLFFTNV